MYVCVVCIKKQTKNKNGSLYVVKSVQINFTCTQLI